MYETSLVTKSTGRPVGLFRNFLRLLIHVLLSVFRPRFHIVKDRPDYLALDADSYTVVASKPEQIVRINGQTVATFKSVEAIHIRHFVRGSGDRQNEWWTVSLKIAGRPSSWESLKIRWRPPSQRRI